MSTKAQIVEQIRELDAETEATTKWTKIDLEVLLDKLQNPVAGRNMSSQLNKYRGGYEPCTSYNGRKSLCNGDDLAHLLSGLTPKEVCQVAERALGLDDGELVAKYASLNPGQQRMNAGNRIRAAIKRGDLTADAVAKVATH